MLPFILSAIPAVAQTIMGGIQLAQGNKMNRGLQDPTMPIPQAAIDALENARTQASSFEVPNESAYLNNIGQTMAGASNLINSGATSSNQALGAILNAMGQQSQAVNDFNIFKGQNYAQNQANLRSQLGDMANWENMKWNVDVMQPFQRQAQAAQAMAGSGIQNLFSGISNISGVGANAALANDVTKLGAAVNTQSGISSMPNTASSQMSMEQLQAFSNMLNAYGGDLSKMFN